MEGMSRPEFFRRVTRIEPDTGPRGAYDSTFFECGHMYRFAPGLGPPVGAQRRCYACEHAAKTVTPEAAT